MSAAGKVFADNGYARASLPAITKRAGVSAGALHFHFPSKDALAAEVESAAILAVREMARCCRRSEGDALGALVAASHHLVVVCATDPVVGAGFRLGGDPSWRNRTGLIEWWHAWVRDMVDQAQRGGELADGVSPEGVAVAVVAATVGFEVLGSRDQDWSSKERMAQFWTFLLPRLASAPEPGPVKSGGRAAPQQTRRNVFPELVAARSTETGA